MALSEVYEKRGPLNIKMRPGKKVISFSLWGNEPSYCMGAIKNAKIAQKIFKDWTCRFYVSNSVPTPIIETLQSFKNTEVVRVSYEDDWRGKLWKLFALEDSSISVVIFRDTDSRLTQRDFFAVEDWIRTNFAIHIVRDHPFHNPVPIPSSSWGLLCEKFRWIPADLRGWLSSFGTDTISQDEILYGTPSNKEIKKDLDQQYLKKIYLNHYTDAFVHDSFPHFNPWSCRNFQVGRLKELSTGFPVTRNAYGDHLNKWDDFVGQKYDENDNPDLVLRSHLQETEEGILELSKGIVVNQKEWING